MEYFNLLNQYNCNIFTDTAFRKQNVTINGDKYEARVTAPGANIYDSNLNIIDNMVTIVHNSTPPRGEIIGIQNGLELGYKYVQPNQTINIFSDSLLSIKGLREWVFGWVHNQKGGLLYGYENIPIKNQEYVLGIVYTILRHNIPVRFYHVKGHTNCNDYSDRRTFYNYFVEKNYIDIPVSDTFITYLIRGNDMIDATVKSVLSEQNIQKSARYWFNNPIIYSPVDMMRVVNTSKFIRSLNMNRYAKLIGVIK